MLEWLNCRHLTLRRRATPTAEKRTQFPHSCSPCVGWMWATQNAFSRSAVNSRVTGLRHANHTSCAMEGSLLGAVLNASAMCLLHLPLYSFGCAWKELTGWNGNCERQKTRLCRHLNLLTNTNIMSTVSK